MTLNFYKYDYENMRFSQHDYGGAFIRMTIL